MKDYYMDPLIPVVIFAIFAGSVAYYLGYDAGKASDERVIDQIARERDSLRYQQRQLTSFVQRNWPNELAAYDNGWDEAYAKALTHADMEDEDPRVPDHTR